VTPALSAGEVAALVSVGFRPSPPTFGVAVLSMPPLVDTTKLAGGFMSASIRPAAYVKGRQLALDRLRARAADDGAVGLVAIRFAERPLRGAEIRGQGAANAAPIEFTAVGVPVHAITRTRPRTLMCTTLSGPDVASLFRDGWCPADVVIAATLEIWDRAKFRGTDAVANTSYRNVEVPGATEVVQRARRIVRDRLHERARVIGADGVLLPDGVTLAHAGSQIVEASATGSAIVRIAGPRRPPVRLQLPVG
jgi:uncharacterized protein YbjQ (UPF0145 family)